MPLQIQITINDAEDAASTLECAFDDPSRTEALCCNTCRDVQACPGSGKTTLLVAKLAVLAKKWTWRDRGICVLSHTNVARREVERRLYGHPAAHRLLGYPHFIGTIQSFVDHYLALPYLRSLAMEVVVIDNDRFETRAKRLLGLRKYTTARRWLGHKWDGPAIVAGLRYEGPALALGSAGGDLNLGTSTSAYRQLYELKNEIAGEGVFRFDDMYAYADACLQACPEIAAALRMRFPWVLIDEMQDTNATQDRLLGRIFSQGCVVQRFGDENQAIFSGEAATEERAATFPSDGYINLTDSKRFGQAIADLASPLRIAGVRELVGNPHRQGRSHTIFLFDAQTIDQVLPSFGSLLGREYSNGLPRDFVAKAVGFRKSQPRPGVAPKLPYNVGDYWRSFAPYAVATTSQPSTLVEIVRKARRVVHARGECSEAHAMIVEGLLELIYRHGKKGALGGSLTKARLFSDLSLCGEERRREMQLMLADWCLSDGATDQESWLSHELMLRAILEALGCGNPCAAVAEFLVWTEAANPAGLAPEQRPNQWPNVFMSSSPVGPIPIELATIYAVKGETHTATLVLETYWEDCYDFEDLVPLMTYSGQPQKQRTPERMKRAYVAMTRPTDLLCLAMHKERLDEEQLVVLSEKGWTIHDLTTRGM